MESVQKARKEMATSVNFRGALNEVIVKASGRMYRTEALRRQEALELLLLSTVIVVSVFVPLSLCVKTQVDSR